MTPTTLAADAAQALQGVTDLIAQANDVATDLSELPETTAWQDEMNERSIRAIKRMTAALTALSEQNAALAAQVAELTRERDEAREANRWAYIQAALDDNQDDLKAAEAKVARLEGALEAIIALDYTAERCGGACGECSSPEGCDLPIYGLQRAKKIARAALTEGTPE